MDISDPSTKAWLIPLVNGIILAVAGVIAAVWNRPPDENGRTFPEAVGYRLGLWWRSIRDRQR